MYIKGHMKTYGVCKRDGLARVRPFSSGISRNAYGVVIHMAFKIYLPTLDETSDIDINEQK